jgi:AcrR family transcriptional regulator
VPEPTTDADGETVRKRILHAAFGAFMDLGYERASTLEIATRARVSKRELYALFGSKQAILRACIAWRASRMLPAEPPPPAGDLQTFSAMLTDYGARLLIEASHPAVLAVHRLAVTESDHSPEIGMELGRVRAANKAAVTALFSQARAAGLLDDADPTVVAQQFMHLLWGDLMQLLLERMVPPPTEEQARRAAQAAAAAVLALHAKPPTGGES